MRLTNRVTRPNEAQAKWLRRIAQSPLMKTYVEGDAQPRFSLQSGATVPTPIAEVLIRNGWVKGRRDGLFGDEQTYAPRPMLYEALRP